MSFDSMLSGVPYNRFEISFKFEVINFKSFSFPLGSLFNSFKNVMYDYFNFYA
jgi:hypothetical protein